MVQFWILSLLLCFAVISQGQRPPLKPDTNESRTTVTVSEGRTPSPPPKTPPPATASVRTMDSTASAIEPSPASSKKEFACSEELKKALAKSNSTLFKESQCTSLRTLVDDDGSPCQVNDGQKYVAYWPNKLGTIWLSNAGICCDLCRVIQECYSWWWKNGKCHLNKIYTTSTYCPSPCAGGNL